MADGFLHDYSLAAEHWRMVERALAGKPPDREPRLSPLRRLLLDDKIEENLRAYRALMGQTRRTWGNPSIVVLPAELLEPLP